MDKNFWKSAQRYILFYDIEKPPFSCSYGDGKFDLEGAFASYCANKNAFGISLKYTPLICIDLDAHNEEEKATLSDRIKILREKLIELGFRYVIEITGRGYHFWLYFDNLLTPEQRNFIYTEIEKVLPNIECRSFDEKYAVRLPGLYKDLKSYSIDEETKLEIKSYDEAFIFLTKYPNDSTKVGKVSAITETKKKLNTLTLISVDHVPTIKISKKNLQALCSVYGLITKNDSPFCPEEASCNIRELLNTLQYEIIKGPIEVRNYIDFTNENDVNGFIRLRDGDLNVFCSRDSSEPLLRITYKKVKEESDFISRQSQYYKIIREYGVLIEKHSRALYIKKNGIYIPFDSIQYGELAERCEEELQSIDFKTLDVQLPRGATEFDGRETLIKSIPKWDGKDWIQLLSKHLGQTYENKSFSAERKLKYFFANLVKKWDVGNRCPVLVLISQKENIGKSFLARWITSGLKDISFFTLFSDGKLEIGDKDSWIRSGKLLLHEISELSDLNRRDTNEIKHFLTAESFVARPPYGRVDICIKTICGYIATVNPNNTGFFRDPGENSRFLPLAFESIDRNYSKIIDPNQILAQALHIYKNEPEQLEITQEEYMGRKIENKLYEREDDISNFLGYLIEFTNNPNDRISAMDIYRYLVDKIGRSFSLVAISEGMQKLGAEKIRDISGKGKVTYYCKVRFIDCKC